MAIGLMPNLYGGRQGTPADAGGGFMGGGLGSLGDPRMLALLGAGGGMLGASQPSRVPVGLGQAMGGALQGGLGGYAMGNMMQRQEKRDNLLEQILRQEADLAGMGGAGGGAGLAGMIPALGGLY